MVRKKTATSLKWTGINIIPNTYKIGIINGQYSYSTAIGLFNTLVNFVFLITANAIAKRVSDTSIF